MPASIDLRKAHLHRPYGDLVAIFSWINDERALFLVPRHRKGAPWFVIMEPAAHFWNDQDASNIKNVVVKSAKACEVLGIEPSHGNCMRIAGIVNDALPDLVSMPSSPPLEHFRTSYGHLEIRADGELIGGEDIRLEDAGVSYA